jgi:murein DD-endopeptidase MepM/ murein hydrolase activator NlpD
MKNCWNLKLSKIVTAIIIVCPLLSLAQFSPPEVKFPNGETYLYPVNPGRPGSLAGTMGELRGTHFHSGIDIRTNNMIGIPILASKSGYISRVTVGPSGYGNVMYITHRDGNTTLYAHLDKFLGPIAEYVLQEQYKAKSSAIDLHLGEQQFPVKRGDTVALSGNSGSSSGPHLHYDIRDPNNYALNPLLVEGFPEIVDNLPPAVEKIALRTLDMHSRINDQFGRFEFYAQRIGNNFTLPVPILANGNIGIEILAKDKLAPKSPFYGGVNDIEVQVDSQLVFKQDIDKINIAETRGIFTLMDFKTMRLRGSRFYKLYLDDGNDLKFYDKSPGNGKIKVNPTRESAIKITMKDSHGNSSHVSFKFMPTPVNKDVRLLEPMKKPIEYDIIENTMMISAQPCLTDSNRAVMYSKHEQKKIEPTYFNVFRVVYLIDLRKEIPDSVVLCGNNITTHISAVVPSVKEYNYYSDLMDIQFPEYSVYDTIYLTTFHGKKPDGSEIFNIGTRTYPLNKSINVTLRPETKYNWDKSFGVYRLAGKGFTYLGGVWENGGIHFSTREFGDFIIQQDVNPPTIYPVAVNNYIARFKIRDSLSGVDKFEANVNGKWLLMHYDAKTATIWSEKMNKTEVMKGIFTLTVTDNAGNIATYTKKLP